MDYELLKTQLLTQWFINNTKHNLQLEYIMLDRLIENEKKSKEIIISKIYCNDSF